MKLAFNILTNQGGNEMISTILATTIITAKVLAVIVVAALIGAVTIEG